ncbi:unnamed protein product, partial [Aphanomyces euteiches]
SVHSGEPFEPIMGDRAHLQVVAAAYGKDRQVHSGEPSEPVSISRLLPAYSTLVALGVRDDSPQSTKTP